MPIGEATLLSQIETELLSGLSPMLAPFDVDGLKQIEVEPFTSSEDIVDLLANFKARVPGAYLNIPRVSYRSTQDVRAADLDLEYAFLVILDNSRAKTYIKKEIAYYFHDQFHRNLFYMKITNCDIPANLDFIRPGSFEVATVGPLMVSLTTFSISVRNWQVREATR